MNFLMGTLTRIIPLALGIMGAVEKIYGAVKGNGPKKREAYIEGLMVALAATESAVGKDMINDEKFKELAGEVADAIISMNNFIRDFKAKETAEA